MANEIQCQLSFRASKGGATVAFQDSFRQNMAGDDMTNQTQLVGTTEEALDTGDVETPYGQIVIKNLDPTNHVLVSSTGFTDGMILKINPLKFILINTDDVDLYVKAVVAPCRILTVAVSP
jgi:hypothetical protein